MTRYTIINRNSTDGFLNSPCYVEYVFVNTYSRIAYGWFCDLRGTELFLKTIVSDRFDFHKRFPVDVFVVSGVRFGRDNVVFFAETHVDNTYSQRNITRLNSNNNICTLVAFKNGH